MVFKKGINHKGKNNPMYGKKNPKRSLLNKLNPPRIGKKASKETKEKISKSKKGKSCKHTDIWNERIGQSNIGKHRLGTKHKPETIEKMKGGERVTLHHKRILQEIPELEKQGFKCIPITKVIPDIVAIKDNKVFAIEVEYQKPNYDKYTDIKHYDDIIWILRKK